MTHTQQKKQEMAKEALAFHAAGDVRYMQFVFELSMSTGTDPNDCHRRIEMMADGDFSFE